MTEQARMPSEHGMPAGDAWCDEVFDSSTVGIVISTPGGRIGRTNPSLDDLLGYSRGELRGQDLIELVEPDDVDAMRQRYQRLRDGVDTRFRAQCRLRRNDGTTAWANLAVSVLRDTGQQPRHVATVVEDVTDQFLLKERLNYQALHDLTTGLPNRQYLASHLEKVVGLVEPAAVVTLLQLDLDAFSVVNDGLGHEAGDRLLNIVARRLESVVTDQQAMVARLGGDEFAILIEPADTVPDAGALAEAVNTALAEPVYLEDTGSAATASIGVVQRPVGASEPVELLRDAGAALRRVRGHGTRQWAMFDPDADGAERAELRLAAAIPGALETGELRVQYRPVTILESRRMVGVEAVPSWRHPRLGLLPAQRFMQLAERTGMVHAVGRWLLHGAAEQAVAWRRRWGDDVPPMLVTTAPSQAKDPDLVATVRAVLQQTGLRPAELELSMPVAALRMADGMPATDGGCDAEDNVRVLATLGVRVGLHDFGGGIGALRCLAELPVSAVRVAEPVSQQVADDPSRILSQSVHALVHIVRAEGVDVVAFPVDSEQQADCWRWVGANLAVGGVIGEPGPAQHIEPLLDARAGPEARS